MNLKTVYIIYFILFYFIVYPLSSLERKSLFEDVAVLRVKDSVLFLSDIKERLDDIKLFKCIVPKSLLLNSLDLNDFDYNNLLVDKKVSRKLSKGVASLEILFNFVDKQGVFIDKKFITSLKLKKCSMSRPSSWPKYLSTLLKVESFLHDRFVLGKIKSDQVLDAKSSRHIFNSINSFMSSLTKQTKIYYYL